MLDVLFPTIVFLTVLVFYVNVRYHRQTAGSREVLVAGSSDDIEEVSRLKLPILFKDCIQCAQDETARMALVAGSGSQLLNSTTGTCAQVEGDASNMSLGRHSLMLPSYACGALSDSGKPPLTISTQRQGFYLQKGSRTPISWNLSLRQCVCVTGGSIVCELVPPEEIDREEAVRGAFDVVYTTAGPHDLLTTRMKAGDILVIPQFWGWKIAALGESSVEAVSYDTVMGVLTRVPETIMIDFRPSNAHSLSQATPAKKRVRWKADH